MTTDQLSAASAPTPGVRPRIGPVPPSDAAEPFARLRPTVVPRPEITPKVWHHPDDLHHLGDPAVRRFWVSALGPGAIADLLRLATAASRGRSLLRPCHLTELARAGLVRIDGDIVHVRTRVPDFPPRWRTRLPPALRRELGRTAVSMPLGNQMVRQVS